MVKEFLDWYGKPIAQQIDKQYNAIHNSLPNGGNLLIKTESFSHIKLTIC